MEMSEFRLARATYRKADLERRPVHSSQAAERRVSSEWTSFEELQRLESPEHMNAATSHAHAVK
jgi:hypothetical protein